MNRRSFAVASAALAAASAASLTAAVAPVVHVRGSVVAATATSVDVRTASGLVRIPYDAATIVQQLVPIARDAIVPNAYVGIATDGTAPGARARYVTVFPEAARGKAEGRHSWDLPGANAMTNGAVAPPQSTMTNGSIAHERSADGALVVDVLYAGGRARVVIPAGTPIVTYIAGTRALVVPGAHVFVFARGSAEHPDAADRILVGKDGFVPPL